MDRKRLGLALLVFLATPLAAQTLLSEPTRLGLGSLARDEDQFGASVALSRDGRTLVAGALKAGDRGTLSGAVHVFRLDASRHWSRDPQFPSTASDTAAFDAYGLSVAVSGDGNVVAVGAPLHDGREGNDGAVYVWERSGEGWKLRSKLTAGADAHRNDELGTSVALDEDGSVLVAGAPQPNPSETPRGKAYVFEWQPAERSWRVARLAANPATSRVFDFFGFAVSIDGDGRTVAVGAPGHDVTASGALRQEAGAAYVFERGAGWSDRAAEDAELLATLPDDGDELGFSIAVSADGGTLVAGAREAGEREDRKARPGSAYVYEREANGWSRARTRLLDSDRVALNGNHFGTSVDLSANGSIILVGAPWVELFQGAAIFFVRPPGGWSARAETKESARIPECTETRGDFGQALALGDGAAAVGAPRDKGEVAFEAGSVCAYDLTGLTLDAKVETPKVVPGRPVSLSLTVTNSSAAPVVDAELTLTFDARLTGASLSCLKGPEVCECAGADACGPEANPGQISALIRRLERGETVTFVFTAEVRPDATGQLHFKIELAAGPEVLDLTANLAKADPDLHPEADLKLHKEVDQSRAVRGTPLHYRITVTNNGPSQVSQAKVTDRFDPAAFASVSWSCHPEGGAVCSRKPHNGDIQDVVTLPLRGKVVYTATAVTQQKTKVRDLINTAMVTSALDRAQESVTTILPLADLRVSISAPREAIPGTTLRSTLTVSNAGPDAVVGARLRAKLGLPGAAEIDQLVSLEKGGQLVFVLEAPIEPERRGSVPTAATITPPSDVLDPDLGNNGDLGSPVLTPLTPFSPLSLKAPVQPDFLVPGEIQTRTYRFEIVNPGPSDLLGAVVDGRPTGLQVVTWSCSPAALCTPSSGPAPVHSQIRLPAGSTLVFVVEARVEDPAAVDPVALELSVQAAPGESAAANQSLEVSTALMPMADVEITVHKGPTAVIPGNSIPSIYTLTVVNHGPSYARTVRVTQNFVPDLQAVSWTCVAKNGSFCRPSGNGEVREDVSLGAAEGSVTFTIKAVAGPEQRGPLQIQARFRLRGATDPHPDEDVPIPGAHFTPLADLAIKSHAGPEAVTAGSTVTYTFTVFNAGPSDSLGAEVTHSFEHASATSWTCVATNGSCPAGGEGEPVAVKVGLRAGGLATFTVKGTAGGEGETLASKATVTAVSEVDPRPENDSLTAPEVEIGKP